MKIAFSIAVLAAMLAFPAPARAADPKGLWLTAEGDAKIRITDCGGALCGTIVWLKQPIDPETGRPATDKQNPDPAKRLRPLVGVQILLGLRGNGAAKWSGAIYNADDGNTYQGNLMLLSPASLKVEGCLFNICQGENWTRSN